MCYTSLVFNCCSDIDISQGSVATHLRYGAIFNDSIITKSLLIRNGCWGMNAPACGDIVAYAWAVGRY